MVEARILWSYGKLYIWTSELNAAQTIQTTSSERLPILSPPKQILIQSLLYKTTACLMRTATTFFDFQMKKKACLKQPLQNFIQRRNARKNIRNNAWKIFICLALFILLLIYNAKFV